jgi:hypothetical protein
MTSLRAAARRRPPSRLWCAAAIALLASCGIRTDPRPPEDTMARAPTEARAVRKAAGVKLEWKSPGQSVDGSRLTDLSAFVVERRVGDDRFAAIGEIPADTEHRLRPVRRYAFIDEEPVEGAEYRIVAYTADGQRGVPGPATKITLPEPKVSDTPAPPS